jgi:hypothetical protein
MVGLLDPPVYFADLKRRLTTVSEAIEYIDTRLPESVQDHRLVQAAREVLCRAVEGDVELVSSHALACALLFTEVNQG